MSFTKKQPTLHINTVVEKFIKPILIKYAGQPWDEEFARIVQRYIYDKTGKYVGFQLVNINALTHAVQELKSGKTFSFSIIPTQTMKDEFNLSSYARRERFGIIYSNAPVTQDAKLAENRFKIALPKIRSKKQYDIQVMMDGRGNAWPVAVIGYYGSNLNGWAKRVGLKHTQGAHIHPSTHYMEVEKANNYVFIIDEIANKFVRG